MGGCTFEQIAFGKDANDAFRKAVDDAQWECGHGGYTGTIAEKRDFIVIDEKFSEMKKQLQEKLKRTKKKLRDEKAKSKKQRDQWEVTFLADKVKVIQHAIKNMKASYGARGIASTLMDINDDRIDDKWGPAGCIPIKGKKAKELKEQRGLKGTRQKPYLFFGWASE